MRNKYNSESTDSNAEKAARQRAQRKQTRRFLLGNIKDQLDNIMGLSVPKTKAMEKRGLQSKKYVSPTTQRQTAASGLLVPLATDGVNGSRAGVGYSIAQANETLKKQQYVGDVKNLSVLPIPDQEQASRVNKKPQRAQSKFDVAPAISLPNQCSFENISTRIIPSELFYEPLSMQMRTILDLTKWESYLTPTLLSPAFSGISSITSLNLSGCRTLSHSALVTMIASIGQHLQILDVSRCVTLTYESIQVISSQCTNLQILDVSECTDAFTDDAINALGRPKKARETQLYDRTPAQQGGLKLPGVCESAAYKDRNGLCMLKALSCRGCVQLSPQALVSFLRRSRCLEILDLSGCAQVTDDVLSAWAACIETISSASSSRRLKVLRLSGCYRITDDGLQALLPTLSGSYSREKRTSSAAIEVNALQVLDLSNCHQLTDASCRAFFERKVVYGYKPTGGFPHLTSLNLSGCANITDLTLSYISASCPKLQTLGLEGAVGLHPFDRRGWLALGNLRHLKECTFSSLRISDACLFSFIRENVNSTQAQEPLAEVSKLPDIKDKCYLFDLSDTMAVSSSLMELIVDTCGITLRVLNISGCTKICDKGIITIAKYCPNLQCLLANYMSNGAITDRSFTALTKRCVELENLGLSASCRNLSVLGFKELKAFPRLKYLNLSCNTQNKFSSGHYLGFLRPGVIQYLDLHDNNTIDDDHISGFAVSNISLQVLNISGCSQITLVGLSQVVQHCSALQLCILDAKFCFSNPAIPSDNPYCCSSLPCCEVQDRNRNRSPDADWNERQRDSCKYYLAERRVDERLEGFFSIEELAEKWHSDLENILRSSLFISARTGDKLVLQSLLSKAFGIDTVYVRGDRRNSAGYHARSTFQTPDAKAFASDDVKDTQDVNVLPRLGGNVIAGLVHSKKLRDAKSQMNCFCEQILKRTAATKIQRFCKNALEARVVMENILEDQRKLDLRREEQARELGILLDESQRAARRIQRHFRARKMRQWRQKRQIGKCFRSWKIETRKQKVLEGLAKWTHETRRAVFLSWRKFARAARMKALKTKAAESLWKRTILSKLIPRWSHLAQVQRRRRKLLASAFCCCADITAYNSKHLVELVELAIPLGAHNVQKGIWRRWLVYVEICKQMRTAKSHFDMKLREHVLPKLFAEWKLWLHRYQTEKAKFQRIHKLMGIHALRNFVEFSQKRHHLLFVALGMWKKSLVVRVFVQWKRGHLALKSYKQRRRRAVIVVSHSHLRDCLKLWQTVAQTWKNERAENERVADNHAEPVRKRKYFKQWTKFVLLRHHKQEKDNKARKHYSIGMQQVTFHAWVTYLRHLKEHVLGPLARSWQRASITWVFRGWTEYCRSQREKRFEVKVFYLRSNCAAKRIQRHLRPIIDARLHERNILLREFGAIKIQKWWRFQSYLLIAKRRRRKRRLEMALREEVELDLMGIEDELSSALRDSCRAVSVIVRALRRNCALLQFQYLKTLGRKRLAIQFQHKQMATREQAVRNKIMAEDHERHLTSCAITIQRIARGFLARNLAKQLSYEKSLGMCVCMLQSLCRGRAARRMAEALRRIRVSEKRFTTSLRANAALLRSMGIRHRQDQRDLIQYLQLVGYDVFNMTFSLEVLRNEVIGDFKKFLDFVTMSSAKIRDFRNLETDFADGMATNDTGKPGLSRVSIRGTGEKLRLLLNVDGQRDKKMDPPFWEDVAKVAEQGDAIVVLHREMPEYSGETGVVLQKREVEGTLDAVDYTLKLDRTSELITVPLYAIDYDSIRRERYLAVVKVDAMRKPGMNVSRVMSNRAALLARAALLKENRRLSIPATKVQASIRGFLARNLFRRLKLELTTAPQLPLAGENLLGVLEKMGLNRGKAAATMIKLLLLRKELRKELNKTVTIGSGEAIRALRALLDAWRRRDEVRMLIQWQRDWILELSQPREVYYSSLDSPESLLVDKATRYQPLSASHLQAHGQDWEEAERSFAERLESLARSLKIMAFVTEDHPFLTRMFHTIAGVIGGKTYAPSNFDMTSFVGEYQLLSLLRSPHNDSFGRCVYQGQWSSTVSQAASSSPNKLEEKVPSTHWSMRRSKSRAILCPHGEGYAHFLAGPLLIDIHPPERKHVTLGGKAEIEIHISGGFKPYMYQWLKRAHRRAEWVNINQSGVPGSLKTSFTYVMSDAVTCKLTLKLVTEDEIGEYACRIRDSTNRPALLSRVTKLIPCSRLVTLQRPLQLDVTRLGTAAIYAQCSGGRLPYIYQWTKDGESLGPDYRNSLITFDNCEVSDSGLYRCMVQDSAGATLIPALGTILKVNPSLTVVTYPKPEAVCLGQRLELSVDVIGGTPPYRYTWYHNGKPVERGLDMSTPSVDMMSSLASSNGSPDAAETDAHIQHGQLAYKFEVSITQLEDGGLYTCEIADSGGFATKTPSVEVCIFGSVYILIHRAKNLMRMDGVKTPELYITASTPTMQQNSKSATLMQKNVTIWNEKLVLNAMSLKDTISLCVNGKHAHFIRALAYLQIPLLELRQGHMVTRWHKLTNIQGAEKEDRGEILLSLKLNRIMQHGDPSDIHNPYIPFSGDDNITQQESNEVIAKVANRHFKWTTFVLRMMLDQLITTIELDFAAQDDQPLLEGENKRLLSAPDSGKSGESEGNKDKQQGLDRPSTAIARNICGSANHEKRRYFPRYSSVAGHFMHDKIVGNVCIRYEGGSYYLGPYVDESCISSCGHTNPEARDANHWGIWKSMEGDTIEGETVDNHFDMTCLEGVFMIRYVSGDLYTGEMKGGVKHGMGEYRYADSTIKLYRGNYTEGKRHGHGVFVDENGNRFDCTWSDDLPHGRGQIIYADGTYYDGQLFRGTKHGRGVLVTPVRESQPQSNSASSLTHTTYRGQFYHGEIQGYGEMYYADGSIYSGEFSRGLRDGAGEWCCPTSAGTMARYLGTFHGDKMDGMMTLYRDLEGSNDRAIGNWEDGSFIGWSRTGSVNDRRTQEFVDRFRASVSEFTSYYATVVAQRLPLVPQGVDQNDPTVKHIIGKIATLMPEIVGKKTITEVEEELQVVQHKVDDMQRRVNVSEMGIEKAEEALAKQREVISQLQTVILEKERAGKEHLAAVENYWANDEEGTRAAYHNAVEAVRVLSEAQWYALARMKYPPTEVEEVMRAICRLHLLRPDWPSEGLKLVSAATTSIFDDDAINEAGPAQKLGISRSGADGLSTADITGVLGQGENVGALSRESASRHLESAASGDSGSLSGSASAVSLYITKLVILIDQYSIYENAANENLISDLGAMIKQGSVFFSTKSLRRKGGVCLVQLAEYAVSAYDYLKKAAWICGTKMAGDVLLVGAELAKGHISEEYGVLDKLYQRLQEAEAALAAWTKKRDNLLHHLIELQQTLAYVGKFRADCLESKKKEIQLSYYDELELDISLITRECENVMEALCKAVSLQNPPSLTYADGWNIVDWIYQEMMIHRNAYKMQADEDNADKSAKASIQSEISIRLNTRLRAFLHPSDDYPLMLLDILRADSRDAEKDAQKAASKLSTLLERMQMTEQDLDAIRMYLTEGARQREQTERKVQAALAQAVVADTMKKREEYANEQRYLKVLESVLANAVSFANDATKEVADKEALFAEGQTTTQVVLAAQLYADAAVRELESRRQQLEDSTRNLQAKKEILDKLLTDSAVQGALNLEQRLIQIVSSEKAIAGLLANNEAAFQQAHIECVDLQLQAAVATTWRDRAKAAIEENFILRLLKVLWEELDQQEILETRALAWELANPHDAALMAMIGMELDERRHALALVALDIFSPQAEINKYTESEQYLRAQAWASKNEEQMLEAKQRLEQALQDCCQRWELAWKNLQNVHNNEDNSWHLAEDTWVLMEGLDSTRSLGYTGEELRSAKVWAAVHEEEMAAAGERVEALREKAVAEAKAQERVQLVSQGYVLNEAEGYWYRYDEEAKDYEIYTSELTQPTAQANYSVWEERTDEASGVAYWYNVQSGETFWKADT